LPSVNWLRRISIATESPVGSANTSGKALSASTRAMPGLSRESREAFQSFLPKAALSEVAAVALMTRS